MTALPPYSEHAGDYVFPDTPPPNANIGDPFAADKPTPAATPMFAGDHEAAAEKVRQDQIRAYQQAQADDAKYDASPSPGYGGVSRVTVT